MFTLRGLCRLIKGEKRLRDGPHMNLSLLHRLLYSSPAIVCTISPSSIFSQGHECQRRVRYWAGMGGHAQGINPAEPNNHITKQFQHRCRNLLFLSQYWFSDNIVSLWIALASKTISGTISPCSVFGWQSHLSTGEQQASRIDEEEG